MNDRDNNPCVRAFIYCLLILLPKESLMSSIFPTNRAPKYPPDLPLISILDAIRMVELLLPNLTRNPSSRMSPWVYPRFVAQKHRKPLLFGPKEMLPGPVKPILFVLLRERRFPSCHTSYVAFFLKSSPYCLLSAILSKKSWDISLLYASIRT